MKLLVLAAGYATRLYPLTLEHPKPLLDVGNRPILDRILDKTAKIKDISDIYVVTNNKFFEKFNVWAKASPYNAKISVINDMTDTNDTRLGAIKDIGLVMDQKGIDDDLMVIAADNIFEFDISKFYDFAKSHSDGSTVALHDIKDEASARLYGVVKIDEKGLVVNFQEKPAKPETTLVSTGVYYFPRQKLSFIRSYNTSKGRKLDAPGYYISWLVAEDKVYGFTFSQDWYDIGDLDTYKKVDAIYQNKGR